VVGVGLGRKLVKGKPTKTTSVRIYVQKKLDEGLLPAKWKIPAEIDGVPTDVIQVGRFKATCDESGGAANRRARRPFFMGASIGHDRIMAGTAGAVLRLAGSESARRFLLSNNHVLANENQLEEGAPIFQPGLEDSDGGPASKVAELAAYVLLKKSGRNAVDCAVAELDAGIVARPELIGLGGAYDRTPLKAREHMSVTKSGRSTGVTRGTIVDVDCDVEVDYPHLGSILFEDQILIAPKGDPGAFSCEGDSGALVVTDDSKRSPVGLLFGSAEKSGATVACHLSQIFARLEIDGQRLRLY
jgi:hypothetical protein